MGNMEPSEADHPLRNDGRRPHHLAELEKDVARLQRKVRELKELSAIHNRQSAIVRGTTYQIAIYSAKTCRNGREGKKTLVG
jgi:hypothetical protein